MDVSTGNKQTARNCFVGRILKLVYFPVSIVITIDGVMHNTNGELLVTDSSKL